MHKRGERNYQPNADAVGPAPESPHGQYIAGKLGGQRVNSITNRRQNFHILVIRDGTFSKVQAYTHLDGEKDVRWTKFGDRAAN